MRVILRSRRTSTFHDSHLALSVQPDGSVQANRSGWAENWEKWDIELVGDETEVENHQFVALRSWTGKYLAGTPDGRACLLSETVGAWEKWKVVNMDAGFVALQSCHGMHLCCDDVFKAEVAVRADGRETNEREHWMIVHSEPDDTLGKDATSKTIGRLLLAVGGVATAGALAIPALGFGSAGVAAGSAAAMIQSAVYGGATTGAFSVLQSIGATMAWAPFAAGGVAIGASGAAVLNKNKKEDAGID